MPARTITALVGAGAVVAAVMVAWRRHIRLAQVKAREKLQAEADAAVAGLPSVPAVLKFKAGTHDGQARHDDAPVAEEVVVHDGRGAKERFTCDRYGFQLVDAPYDHSIKIYDEPYMVVDKLYPQMEKVMLANLPGARRVLIFDHLIRNRKRLDDELEQAEKSYKAQERWHKAGKWVMDSLQPAVPKVMRVASCDHEDERRCCEQEKEVQIQPKTRFLEMPLGHVHGDYTVRSGYTRARQLLEPYCSPAEIDAALGQRFAIVNVWHPIGPQPVARDPLTCCLWGSFAPRDVMTKRLTFPHRVGETYQALPSSSHRWIFFSAMSRDEALLLKTFDTADDGVTARFSIHSAFRLPAQDGAGGEALPIRESIELRALVLYGEGVDELAADFINPSLAGPDAPLKAREQAKLTELELYNLVSSETLPPSDEW